MRSESDTGLMHLLLALAKSSDAKGPLTIVTTNHNMWLEQTERVSIDHSLEILDISAALGLMSESDIAESVSEHLIVKGWPVDSVIREYRLSSRTDFIVDIALLDQYDSPVAFVEVKREGHDLNAAIEQVRRYSLEAKIRFGIATDGKKVILADFTTESIVAGSELPTPTELGQVDLKADSVSDYGMEYEASEYGVVTQSFRTIDDLIRSLKSTRPEVLIIDHTIPTIVHEIQDLPETLRTLRRLDLATALLVFASSLDSMQVLVGVVPRAVIISARDRAIRQSLERRLRPSAVIDLPQGREPSPLSLLRMSPARVGPKRVLFASIATKEEMMVLQNQPWVSDIESTLADLGEPKFAVAVDVSSSISWTPQGYEQQTVKMLQRLSQIGELAKLGEVCQVLPGMKHSREETVRPHGVPVIRGRDLARSPAGPEDLGWFNLPTVPERVKVRKGDILLQRIGSQLHVVVADEALVDVVASDTVFILRPVDQRIDPNVLGEFLSSPDGQRLLSEATFAITAPTLRASRLRELSIPIIPKETAGAIQEIATVEKALRSNAEQLKALRLSVFSSESMEAFRNRLSTMHQQSSVMAASLKEAKSFDFQIGNFFPYPIAFGYRSLKSITDLGELYKEQLRFAENIMAFLGSVTMALIDPTDRQNSGIDLKAAWQGGISPGTWCGIADRGARILSEYKDHRLAKSMAEIWSKPTRLAKALDELKQAKNDFKHDRGPKIEEDYVSATVKVGSLLDTCMQELAFFTEYPIRLIYDIKVVRGSRNVFLQTYRCTGDHPALPQEQLEYPETLPERDLFIEVGGRRWIPLFPFVTAHNCSSCKTREIYFIDKWQGLGKAALLKSFERGHTEEKMEVGAGLSTWSRQSN